MDMIDKRLNDKGKNWRHVLKALKVTDYCLHEGSELVVTWAKQNIFIIKTLREFQYIDEDGRDVGQNGGYWTLEELEGRRANLSAQFVLRLRS
jgi:epsin